MRVEELVGSIQTFELLLPQPKNSKNIALKTKIAGKEKSGVQQMRIQEMRRKLP
jgi:hypothetical protein